ncbi:conserved hypothetical protein [Hyella patelloides LEGE 07179]|uniref:CHAT domain-containing protein n=1 Tax=Hyella patelloides LEGE 07179 TaxID=945734 RepID=A0A563VU46_9CYAN|nr:CHAT domain-containing protein [Hyella patelloides]VEP14933.1 conserved hypothetical protein [Hyella patelloides LEGE 07179]
MKICDRIISSICLVLLTFLLVTRILPAAQSQTPNIYISSNEIAQGNPPETLLNQGRILYEAGRFTAAASVWQQAAQGYEQQQDSIGQAWSFSYLSLAQQALGKWQEATTAIAESRQLLESSPPEPAILAQVLNIQGHLQSSTGQTESAIQSWQQAEAAYRNADDKQGIWGSQINQSQALRRLGLYHRAETILNSLEKELQAQSDSSFKVQGLQSLGIALKNTGKLAQSQTVLEQSLAIAKRLGSAEIANKLNPPLDTSSILFSLGNAAREARNLTKALEYYQLATKITNSQQIELKTQLNLLRLYLQLEQPEQAIALIPLVESHLSKLPPSRASINATVNFAESLERLETSIKEQQISSNSYISLAERILTNAVNEAKTLKDIRAQALVLTQLGKLLAPQQPKKALTVTNNALLLAQQIDAPEIVARAAWQLGKLYRQQGDIQQAITAYELTFDTLQTLRTDLASINAETQFSFTESIEPIYRQLVSLLLTSTKTKKPANRFNQVSQVNLRKARQVIEALQLAELDNFFHEACLKTQSVQLDEIDSDAAIIYPIILPDRLEVILSIPGQPLSNYTTHLAQAEVESVLQLMRQSLNPAYAQAERLKLYQQAYNWLIEPAASQLENSGIKTLVFVLDGSLRNVPMSALYDGKQYLLEKYSTVISPGLQLLQPQNLANSNLIAIAAGLSEANQGFQALPGVEQELAKINTQIEAKILLNQNFTQPNLQNTFDENPFSILHLATHGKFSSNAEETFVLAWNGKINARDFDTLIRSRETNQANPIELLVLSACQTAKGDPRAILGLAGLAVRSGASSTLGTLWAVRDRSTTKLMTEFYQHLGQPGVTRAEALRRAQLSLIEGEYNHPVYWAAFVLVGNWS